MKALVFCTLLLTQLAPDYQAMYDRAYALMLEEKYEEATALLVEVYEHTPDDRLAYAADALLRLAKKGVKPIADPVVEAKSRPVSRFVYAGVASAAVGGAFAYTFRNDELFLPLVGGAALASLIATTHTDTLVGTGARWGTAVGLLLLITGQPEHAMIWSMSTGIVAGALASSVIDLPRQRVLMMELGALMGGLALGGLGLTVINSPELGAVLAVAGMAAGGAFSLYLTREF